MHDPGLNFDLGETIDSLRSAIQDFAANEIAPRAADIDRGRLASNGWPLPRCSSPSR